MVSTMTCWDYLLTSYSCSCWFCRMADNSCQEDKSLYGLLRDGLLRSVRPWLELEFQCAIQVGGDQDLDAGLGRAG